MLSITSEQFDATIVLFSELIVGNLQSTLPFKVLSSIVRTIGEDKCLFFSIDLLVDIQIRIDFTVSYDKFYQVPIYHLRLFINDKLDFDIEKVWNILRSNDNQRLEKVDLLIVDHALLQSPWLQIHPCETLNTLDIFTKGQNINQETETGKESKSTLQYLICWFNLYALPTTFPQFSLRPNSAAAVAVVDAADATTTTTTTTQ